MRWWHVERLLPVEADLFGPERWSAGMFWNELANANFYVVALEDHGDLHGDVIGYAGLTVSPPDEAWVQNIAVSRDFQRHGVGRALLGTLLAEARRHGTPRTLLEVAVNNTPAQHLYARYGFEPVAVRKGYYQPSNIDALVMMREETNR